MLRELVFIPLKDFSIAKSRLRSAGVTGVDELVSALAENVLAAASPRRTVIVGDSTTVRTFAASHETEYFEEPTNSLNGALSAACDFFRNQADMFIIAHGDILQPAGLGSVTFDEGVTIVTDHHGDGTNVLAIPSASLFTFYYGANSASAHEREASRLGLPCTIWTSHPWGHDVDVIDDLP